MCLVRLSAVVEAAAGGHRRPIELCPTKLSMVTSGSGTDHPSVPAYCMATRINQKSGKPSEFALQCPH